MADWPPALVLVLGGLALPLAPPRLRAGLLLGLPLVTLALVWNLDGGAPVTWQVHGYEVAPVRADPLGRLFAIVFAIMAFAGALFALRQARVLELAFAFVYAGSAIGVALAGDLLTLFVFWELMALASTGVLLAAGGGGALRAGGRYFVVHMLGGAFLMAGVLLHVSATGSLAFTAMEADSWGTWLILAGVLVNAAAPPLSAWLPDAYPESSWSGMVFLSAFTTKAAVYVLIRGFPGTEALVWVGLFMIFYGIIYALLENDMRRILAYSIVNQVGFMVAGVGIGTEMALNGAAAHAFTHIIYKALLLMSAGSVLYMTGRRKCTDLGGLFRTMPLTTLCGTVGALAISSFPLTSGFVSKSMIAQAATDEALAVTWLLLMAASAGVFLHAGIKFPWFVFFQKGLGASPPRPALEHAGRDGALRRPLHRDRDLAGPALWAPALPGGLRAVHRPPRGERASASALLRARVLPDAAPHATDPHRHPRLRLALAPGGRAPAVERGGGRRARLASGPAAPRRVSGLHASPVRYCTRFARKGCWPPLRPSARWCATC